MHIYIPNSYNQWLTSNPTEGQILLVGLLTKFASIYGNAHYFEMYNDDIDAVNFTAKPGTAVQQTKKLKDAGLIDIIRGLDTKLTIRLSQDYIGKITRRNLYDNSITYELSNQGAILWSYLLGRLANLDETQETVQGDITPISKIRSFDTTRTDRFPTGKKSLTHILAPIYNDLFIKRNIAKIQPETDPEKVLKRREQKKKISQEWYAKIKAEREANKNNPEYEDLTPKQRASKEWYLKNKEEILQKKKNEYYDKKKSKKNGGV